MTSYNAFQSPGFASPGYQIESGNRTGGRGGLGVWDRKEYERWLQWMREHDAADQDERVMETARRRDETEAAKLRTENDTLRRLIVARESEKETLPKIRDIAVERAKKLELLTPRVPSLDEALAA